MLSQAPILSPYLPVQTFDETMKGEETATHKQLEGRGMKKITVKA